MSDDKNKKKENPHFKAKTICHVVVWLDICNTSSGIYCQNSKVVFLEVLIMLVIDRQWYSYLEEGLNCGLLERSWRIQREYWRENGGSDGGKLTGDHCNMLLMGGITMGVCWEGVERRGFGGEALMVKSRMKYWRLGGCDDSNVKVEMCYNWLNRRLIIKEMTLAGRKSTCCRIGVIGEIVSWCFWHDGGDSYDLELEEVVLPWQGGGNSIGNCSMVVEWNNLRRCIRCSKLWIALDQRERSKDMSYTYRFHNFGHRKTTYQKSSSFIKMNEENPFS